MLQKFQIYRGVVLQPAQLRMFLDYTGAILFFTLEPNSPKDGWKRMILVREP